MRPGRRDELTERLARCYTGAVHDVLRMMGHERVRAAADDQGDRTGTRLAGPVWTVSGHIDRTQSRDETLLAGARCWRGRPPVT